MSSLKDKITSEQDLELATTQTDIANANMVLRQSISNFNDGSFTSRVNWWAIREYLRLHKGIYDTTDALVKLNEHVTGLFAHISTEDPTMVAYTPDKAFGESDRQLRISFGKLVTRFLPFASDAYIGELTAWHNAELSNEIEWITGIDIAATYAADTSTGACMSNKSNFKVQPTLAYAAEGIKMAVIRLDGKIRARAMCYEGNGKKVFIRAYGSPMLAKRLKRLGYVVGDWTGVKFNTLFLDFDNFPLGADTAKEYLDSEETLRVVVPYLDANGSTCSVQYSSVALIDGVLTCVNSQVQAALSQIGFTTKVPSTTGYVELVNVSSDKFTVTDVFTGETLNTLTNSNIKQVAMLEGGQLLLANFDCKKTQLSVGWTIAQTLVTGTIRHVYARPEHTFDSGHQVWLDTKANRIQKGWVELDKTIYPTLQWGKLSKVVKCGENFILTEDAAAVISKDADGKMCTTTVHKSQIPAKAIRLKDSAGMVGYCTAPELVQRTPSKAKVVLGWTDGIVETWNGVDYKRNVKVVQTIFNHPIYGGKREDLTTPEFAKYCEDKFNSIMEAVYKDSKVFIDRLDSLLYNEWSYIHPRSGNTVFTSYVRASDAASRARRQGKNWVQWCKEFLESFIYQMQTSTKNKWYVKAAKQLLVDLAEMTAVEYTNDGVEVSYNVTETATVVNQQTYDAHTVNIPQTSTEVVYVSYGTSPQYVTSIAA